MKKREGIQGAWEKGREEKEKEKERGDRVVTPPLSNFENTTGKSETSLYKKALTMNARASVL